MKRFIIISVLLAFSCNKSSESVNTENANVEKNMVSRNNFEFLTGNWQRVDEEEGKQTFENWKKINDSTYAGHSFTLKEKDTVWQENVILSPIKNAWHFQVSIPSENQSTDFLITEQTSESFTCENPENEFPKIIRYWKEGNSLKAEISDGKTVIPFEFKKI